MIEKETLLIIKKSRIFINNILAGAILLIAIVLANLADGEVAHYARLAITFSIGLIWGKIILDPQEVPQ